MGYTETMSMASIQKKKYKDNTERYHGQRGECATFIKVNEGDVLKVY